MTAIQILIKEIKNLKPIPAVIHPLLEKVDDPKASMEDISNIIQYDPALTASVLRTTNSAFFGLKHPAESIKDAVNLLGTDQIIDLVLLKSGTQVLNGKQPGYDLNEGAIWKYSVSSAIIARQIAVTLDIPHKSRIFTAALLKDIGKTVLDKFVQNVFEKISDLVVNKNLSFVEAEKKIIGVDHAELGGMIAKMWKFSPKMVKIIRNHHIHDDKMIQDQDIAVVYLADCICMMMGMGVGADGLAYRFHKKAMKKIGITAEDITRIIAEFTCQIQELEDLLQTI
ncbi:MAG: HDOD domain-containing protein [Desulfobacter sp.]|nr:HDOD domain-containing protein [Desulfobacter sp.]WDP84713.1 MAG: HDOD domain-containing protein [Desulfobacter sp.]